MSKSARAAHIPRGPQITFPSLARADGSASFAFSSSSSASSGPHTLASVSGPIEVRLAAEHPSRATLDVLVRPLANVPSTHAKSLGAQIRGVLAAVLVLEAAPRTGITVVLQAMAPTAEGAAGTHAMSAAMINAAMLALLNAGSVPMRGVVCAVPVGLVASKLSGEAELVVDPEEKTRLLASGCFAFLFTSEEGQLHGRCVMAEWTFLGERRGGVGANLSEVTQLAQRGAREVYAAVYQSVDRGMWSSAAPTLYEHSQPGEQMEL
ncbi:hypothetical protein H0H81_002115 [Sphagnurus paluster]|uniref:Exoribonuclease phosphorolytic domain-containing protein n=1 Tax=Sphagnurus paluster TaxID=117069 RepID=A0A9P7FM85_9AGAR|nr:hypothetical protein H0H81_002115 [Sphagnurus paluster]